MRLPGGRPRALAVAGAMGTGLAVALAAVALATPAAEGSGASAGPLGSRASAGPAAPPFHADSAFALLARQVAFGPRVPGGPGHRAQLAWMTERLRGRADTVVLQPFTHTGPAGETLALTNVLARFRPGHPDRVLLVAHWDTRPTADREPEPEDRRRPIPGANDGASGTAVLLHLADVLFRHSPPTGVDLLFVDGEDYAPGHMYLGATHFARTLPPGYAPRYGVVVDMVADRSPRFPPEGYSRSYAPEVVDRVWRTARALGHARYFPDTPGLPIADDHVPLNQAGIPTIDIIDFDYPHWHTLADDLAAVSPEGLGVVGEVLVALLFGER